ncbi:uncharacterized protein TrAtP1_004937 [Trichoderma atroviride]|nr:hypothetical protein TrAtP1_004937 [Trichoderma atroviride]
MSLYYDPQLSEEDLTHTWGTNTIINPASLGTLDSSRIPLQHMHTKSERTQPGTYLQPTEFLPVTSTHNVGPTFQRGSSIGFDPSSSYVSGGCVHPLQNIFPNNAFFSMQGGQHNQPVLSYAQQLLSYNRRYPNLNTEFAQNDPSLIYPEYPLLDNQNIYYNSYNSSPYGNCVIEQTQQNFMNPYLVNAGYTMNSPYQSQHTQTESSQNSTKENEEPSTNRAAKQKDKDPPFDPRPLYGKAETRDSWGSKTWVNKEDRLAYKLEDLEDLEDLEKLEDLKDLKKLEKLKMLDKLGKLHKLFAYTEKGQWLLTRKFNDKQLRKYAKHCPEGTVFRVQQYPTNSKFRMSPEDQECRWANCPLKSNKITTGWLRVCFDEFPMETSSGKRDPFLCAGSMHLWCFEQVFDPVEFYLEGRLIPEIREFDHEKQNVMSLKKLTDAEIIKDAYNVWFAKWVPSFERHGKQVPREYQDTLSYTLNDYHVEHQTDARDKSRETRHEKKLDKTTPKKTIEVHLGDLKLFAELERMTQNAKKAKRAKKANRRPEMEEREDPPSDGFDSSDLSRIRIPPPQAPRTKKAGSPERLASYLPIDPALGTSSSHLSQTKRRSPRGSEPKLTSPRRHKKEVRRRVLASQPPVDRGHNLSTDSCSSTSTSYLNTSSTPSSSFSSLNSACSTLPLSNLGPPRKTIVSPNHNQSSLANAYTSVYSQAMPRPSSSMEYPTQPGHSLGPPSWQYQQQQYSSTAALPFVEAEHQPEFHDCNLNTPLKVSRGNDLVEPCQNETKTWTQEAAAEASQVLGDSERTSLNDSNQFKGLDPEEPSIDQFLIFDDDVPEPTENPAEGSTGAMDNFAAQTQMNAAASQPLELVACAESPQVDAMVEPWHSYGSFMDPMNYGAYSNTDILPLFDDSIATA